LLLAGAKQLQLFEESETSLNIMIEQERHDAQARIKSVEDEHAQEVDTANSINDELRALISSLNGELESANSIIVGLRASITDKDGDLESSKSIFVELRASVADLKENMDSKNNAIEHLKNNSLEQNARLESSLALITRFEAQEIVQAQSLVTARCTIQDLEDIASKRAVDFEAKDALIKEANDVVGDMTAKLDVSQSHLAESQSRIVALEQDVKNSAKVHDGRVREIELVCS
jgi:peptidoglycan hydrolase CwlO-like protein